MTSKSMCLVFLAMCFISTSFAQIIQVKTYPVLSDNSVLQFPSTTSGLGNISFALRDKFSESFNNPAFLPLIEQSAAFLIPRWSSWEVNQSGTTIYPQSNDYQYTTHNGASNNQFSTGMMYRNGGYGIAAVGSYQKMHSSVVDNSTGISNSTTFDTQQYPIVIGAGIALGKNISIGALYNYLPVKGMDGIQFLYPGSKSVSVSGSLDEYRFGIAGSFGSSDVDVVIGRSLFAATHGAVYEWGSPVQNDDKNNTVFSQISFSHCLSEKVSLASTITANWKDLPKLPNYPVAGIPRDPGYTQAFNLGVGVNWNMIPFTMLVFEYLYEPISADTWVDALETRTIGERTIVKGERERENNYDFHNHILRLGLQLQPEEWLKLQVGSEMHSYEYDYEMKDRVNNVTTNSSPENEWTEISLTGGVLATIGNIQLGYTLEFLTGRGIVEQQSIFWAWDMGALVSNDVMLVPNNFLKVNPVNVVSHRITVMYLL